MKIHTSPMPVHTADVASGHFKPRTPSMEPVLRTYYISHLENVVGVKPRSVGHYLNGLSKVSKTLVELGLIKGSIYDILDLDTLESLADAVEADPGFKHFNKVGHQMYSSALHHYLRFARGEEFGKMKAPKTALDIPVPAEALPDLPAPAGTPVPKNGALQYRRSTIIRERALGLAGHKCEIDGSHETFIAERTKLPYMEGHHAIPLSMQPNFGNSLDVYANLVCLCPLCHRMIHLAGKDVRRGLMMQLYEQRSDRLAKSGLPMTKDEFVELVSA